MVDSNLDPVVRLTRDMDHDLAVAILAEAARTSRLEVESHEDGLAHAKQILEAVQHERFERLFAGSTWSRVARGYASQYTFATPTTDAWLAAFEPTRTSHGVVYSKRRHTLRYDGVAYGYLAFGPWYRPGDTADAHHIVMKSQVLLHVGKEARKLVAAGYAGLDVAGLEPSGGYRPHCGHGGNHEASHHAAFPLGTDGPLWTWVEHGHGHGEDHHHIHGTHSDFAYRCPDCGEGLGEFDNSFADHARRSGCSGSRELVRVDGDA
jgi:hypothetical protein